MLRLIKEIVSHPAELATHLCWMAVVVALIYAIHQTPLSDAWQAAISEGIAIFGGVELILDKIGDIRRNRENAKIREQADKAEQAAAKAEQKADKAEQAAAAAEQKAAKAEQAAAEKDEIIKELRQRLGDPEA